MASTMAPRALQCRRRLTCSDSDLTLQGGKVLRMEPRLHGLDYGPSGLAVQEATTREEKLAMNKRYEEPLVLLMQ